MIVVFNTFWTAMEVYSTEDYEDNTCCTVLVRSVYCFGLFMCDNKKNIKCHQYLPLNCSNFH